MGTAYVTPATDPAAGKAAPVHPLQAQDIEHALVARREKIYPREVHGLFARLRITAVVLLLGLFYALPWVSWDNRQAILLDLPARKFHVLGLTFWPQDFLYLALLLILAGLSLFFFTALAGRLWCGYACPQTVWTETFLWIERIIEGDRIKQQRLDRAPWSARKLRLKATKHIIWVSYAAFTGFTFVSYFTPAKTLLHELLTVSMGPWETFWMCFYSLATYGNAGWMREQVCIYMCPYARFQSAMFDNDTLIVSYDKARGEPKGSRRPGTDHKSRGLGDCIDCTLCVQVCPTGIDIRHGLQYQCIGCSACIDVCNDVMDKMQYPKGLIRYTTQHALQGRKTRILRPRILIYGVILLGIMGAFAWSLASRVPVGLDVIHDRNQLFRETQWLIENVYTLKLLNMQNVDVDYVLDVAGIDDMQLILDQSQIHVPAGTVYDLPARIRAAEANLPSRSTEIIFTLHDRHDDAIIVSETAKFIGPAQ